MKNIKRILKYLLTSLLILLISFTIFIFYHHISLYFEKNGSYELGENEQYIDFNSHNFHIYDSEYGQNIIVLLSGYGTASPIIDFKPLTKLLEKEYRVIVLEYLGYGLSDDTEVERTIDNICYEIHSVLNKLAPNQKYILAAHSFSGIYSHYYASLYPQEVAAIIGIDNSVPLQFVDINSDITKDYIIKQQILGLTGLIRLASIIAPGMLTENMSGIYSEEDLIKFSQQTVKNHMNNSLLDEIKRIGTNARKAIDIELPSIPSHKF